MTTALQYIEPAANAEQAADYLAHCATQVDYLGGRVLSENRQGDPWRCQAFFAAGGVAFGDWLPDGLRLVIIPEGRRKALGIHAV